MPTDTLDEMVRDFTQAVPRSKSEVRSRIVAAMDEVRREERVQVIKYLVEVDEREGARTMAYSWGMIDTYYELMGLTK
jgi:hypothetical protein